MDIRDAVWRIHMLPVIDAKVVIAMAGNGSQAIGELMSHGRGSSTVLGQHLLYANELFDRYIGGRPDKYVSEKAARQLAMAAYREAIGILALRRVRGRGPEGEPVGIGCTSALVKPDGERDGREHVIYLCTQTSCSTESLTYHLTPGASREQEEQVNSLAILHAVAKARLPDDDELSISLDPELWMREPEHEMAYVHTPREVKATKLTHEVMHDYTGMAVLVGDPYLLTQDYAVLSGSFNPLHDAHVKMAEYASKRLQRPVLFELSITNPDKPPLDYIEIEDRVKPFRDRGLPLVITNRPKFMEKSMVFKSGTIFVVGADTYDRIDDEQYYKDGRQYAEAMHRFQEGKNEFLVFCRKDATGKVKGVRKTGWVSPLDKMSHEVPPSEFIMDVSSSSLRNPAD